jgi:hypothetical protein
MRSLVLVAVLGLIGLPLPEHLPAASWTARVVGSEVRCGVLYLQVREASTDLLLLDAAGREPLFSMPREPDGSGSSALYWRRLRSVVDIAIEPGIGPRAIRLSIDASQCRYQTPKPSKSAHRQTPETLS